MLIFIKNMEYSFMFYVMNDMSFPEIKKVIESYCFGELYGIQCVTHPNGFRHIVVHYKNFTNALYRNMLDVVHFVPYLPYVLYGKTHLWYIYKTLTISQRTTVHFQPINGSSKN
jgi:hypothetical protein